MRAYLHITLSPALLLEGGLSNSTLLKSSLKAPRTIPSETTPINSCEVRFTIKTTKEFLKLEFKSL
jgi:hypothetical protein